MHIDPELSSNIKLLELTTDVSVWPSGTFKPPSLTAHNFAAI